MSVDAHELEREALQRKDREQLQTIAAALGRKAPARARKEQIIDLIIELAGGPPSQVAPETPAGGDRTVPPWPRRLPEADPLPFAPPEDRTEPVPSGPELTGAEKNGDRPGAVVSFSPFDDAAEEAAARASRAVPPDTASSVTDYPPPLLAPAPPAPMPDRNGDSSIRPRPADGNGVVDEDSARPDTPTSPDTSNSPDHPESDGGGEGQGEREGGRRRRRRGRDKDRLGVERTDRPDRPERVNQVSSDRGAEDNQGPSGAGLDAVPVSGFLDLRDEGYGFLRLKGYLPSKEDVYVPAKFVRQYALRKGDQLAGSSRPAGRGEKNPALLRVDQVNGIDPDQARLRPRFEELTPLFPDQHLRLSRTADPLNMTARIIDLISPIGKGQRGLIVSPPKAGKTTVMKTIAKCIEANNPEVKLIVLLVDERPEEVTDMRRSVQGEVVASTFDRPADEHTHVAEMTIERAKRMVEQGEDVVIILDGITRLARAYNLAAPATGRIMSGGIDTGALYPPKRFFGAARNVEEGGSLTILATALVETGSRMDEVIFEEFKGTGNMELRLDRRLAEKRIYPAIDVDASSTRHEELLFERKQLQFVWKLRRVLSGLAGDGAAGAGLELLVDRMRTFKSNDEFLAEVAKAPTM